jgi:1-deoxy-D-xylulose-5-phosphate reductoisomerase
MLAHMCLPDMRIPISFALYYPEKSDFVFSKLSLKELNSLHFREVNGIFSKSIALARFVLNKGKTAPLIYNGANEIAVLNFLQGKISFLDIFTIVEKAVEKIKPISATTISEMIEFDEEVRVITNEYVTKLT